MWMNYHILQQENIFSAAVVRAVAVLAAKGRHRLWPELGEGGGGGGTVEIRWTKLRYSYLKNVNNRKGQTKQPSTKGIVGTLLTSIHLNTKLKKLSNFWQVMLNKTRGLSICEIRVPIVLCDLGTVNPI